MNKMKAAVLEGVRQLNPREVKIPEISEREVLIKVMACGICQTDYKAYTGERMNWAPPAIMGHEISGIISNAGKGITEFREGDEVVVSPVVSCDLCEYCRVGMHHYCRNNRAVIGGDGADILWDGGFAEYVKAPVSAIFYKAKGVSFPEAALTEPLAGSYKGLIENTKMIIGEDVVIIGAGGMGLLLAQIAKASGAGKLIVIDVDDYKLAYAKNCGADILINSKRINAREAIYNAIPNGPDIVFEAAGPLAAAELAYDLCRRGTRINMFGVTTPGTIAVSPADIHFNEIKMDASFSVNAKSMIKAINLMDKKLVDTGKIITHRYKLDDIQKAFDKMSDIERIKIIIEPNHI